MATAPAKVSLPKRDPVVVGGAIIGILESIIFYAGDAGFALPIWLTAGIGLIVAVAGVFGIRANARPAALSVPASEAVAQAAKAAKSAIKGRAAPLPATAHVTADNVPPPVAKPPSAIEAAKAKATAKIKGG